MYKIIFSYRTIYADLDTQRHVNSNRYFDLFTSGKYLLLGEQGFPVQYLFANHLTMESCRTSFKFLNQVVENKQIDIEVTLAVFNNGYLNWNCEISHDGTICVKINSLNKVNANAFKSLITEDYPFEGAVGLYNIGPVNAGKYSFESRLRLIDRNYFGQIPENMSWRLFEENRWKHSCSLNITLDFLNDMDLAFFWYEGEYRFNREFQASEKVKSSIWIEKARDFRLIYAHEISNQQNEIICNSLSTFVPVSITTGRPKRIPVELVQAIEEYINKDDRLNSN